MSQPTNNESVISVGPNPPAIILRALYGLYLDHRDDPGTLKRVEDVAWALDMRLGYDYAYFELAELIMSRLHDPSQAADHYVDQIEAQLRTFDNYEQQALFVSLVAQPRDQSSSPKESFSVRLWIEEGELKVWGGPESARQPLLKQIEKLGAHKFDHPHQDLEILAQDLPRHIGEFEVIWRSVQTRDEVYPPQLSS